MAQPRKTPVAPPPEPRWLNSVDAAFYLNVPITSLRRWVAAGLLNPSKPSGFLRGPSYFKVDELDLLMENNRASALHDPRS